MSKQPEKAAVLKRLKRAQNVERAFGAGFLFGIGFTILGFFLMYDPPPGVGRLGFLYLGIAGLIALLVFLFLYLLAFRQKKVAIRQFENLGHKIQTCKNCGKMMPHDKAGFCLFCGSRAETIGTINVNFETEPRRNKGNGKSAGRLDNLAPPTN